MGKVEAITLVMIGLIDKNIEKTLRKQRLVDLAAAQNSCAEKKEGPYCLSAWKDNLWKR